MEVVSVVVAAAAAAVAVMVLQVFAVINILDTSILQVFR